MVAIKRFATVNVDFTAKMDALLAFEAAADEGIERTVAGILADVKARGDAAVVEYSNKFDRLTAKGMADLELSQIEMQKALDGLPIVQRQALEAAAQRVRVYHEKQRLEGWSYTEADGTMLGQMITPLDRVGLYVPGGKAAYPSSVLMNAIPAKVAGVKELIMVVPTPGGEHNQLVLAAACLAGVNRVFTIGGAQAVGALAYGTQTVPQVDKIVGPGNAYVATAKRRVFGIVGIDMVAGPSEILVVSDGSGNPDWVAMDLFSQAEHDELAQSILICTDAAFIEQVQASIERLLPTMPRRAVIETSLTNRGAFIHGPRHGRGGRHRQPRRAGTPRTGAGRSRSVGERRSTTPAPSSSATTPRNRSATTAPGRTTCCRPRAAPAFRRRSASMIFRSGPA